MVKLFSRFIIIQIAFVSPSQILRRLRRDSEWGCICKVFETEDTQQGAIVILFEKKEKK